MSPKNAITEGFLSLIKSKYPKYLSKSFKITETGELIKTTGGVLADGTVTRMRLSADGLADLVQTMGPSAALTLGVTRYDTARVVTAEALRTTTGTMPTVARTKEFFRPVKGNAWLLFDCDGNTAPDEFRRVMCDICPGLGLAPSVLYSSAGSHIYTSGGECLRGQTGLHWMVMIADATDRERALKVLAERLWLAGHGRYDVSRSGSLLDRTIIDVAVYGDERLIFSGGAACGPGLEQRRPDPVVFNEGGTPLDTREAIPDLDRKEAAALRKMKDQARATLKPTIDATRAAWIDERLTEAESRAKDEGNTSWDSQAARDSLVRAIVRRRLMGDFILETESGPVSVATVLDNKQKWHGMFCRDPLEPDYQAGNHRIARIYLFGPGKPNIYSYAHGGQVYHLERQTQQLRIEGGALPQITSTCLSVMALDCQVYERGSELARISDGQIVPLTAEWLTWYLSGLFSVERVTKDGAVPCDIPPAIAKTLLALSGNWNLPKLKTVITAPTMTTAGRIIEAPGLDNETGLYLDFRHADEWRPVPAVVSAEQAATSIRVLWKVFETFPFVGPADVAGMLAALLTSLVNPALPTSPAFAILAPVKGSGKTLISMCLSILAGHRAEVLPRADTDDEMRKTLLAIGRAGVPVILWDNLTGHVKSDAVCTFLTSEQMLGRVLGFTNMTSVPTTSLFLMNGNNLVLSEDLTRRVVSINIDPCHEKPFLRKFEVNPYEYCKQNRLELIWHGLTFLRGYMHAGRPAPPDSIGSFEAWNELIRGAVLWIRDAGFIECGDPAESIYSNDDSDPELQKLKSLLYAWKDTFGTETKTVGQVIREADKDKDGELFESLDEIAGERGIINSRRLGRWIERNRGRIVDGMRFESDGEHNRAKRWRMSFMSNMSFFSSSSRAKNDDSYTHMCNSNGPEKTQKTLKTHTCFTCCNFRASRLNPTNGPGVCLHYERNPERLSTSPGDTCDFWERIIE